MEQKHIESFKEVLAQAILMGNIGSDNAYRGAIDSPENNRWVTAMKTLYHKVEVFIDTCDIEGISAADVLPLQVEIEALTKND